MKSEFMLAFNEICQERGLPQDTVIEALKTALVSAYRRNANVSNSQEVTVEIDPRTGEPTIYAEKEVVDSIIDNRTEVLMDVAKAQGIVDAEYGETVMVESTPRNFGRIAAQTAKQVILQRVREAEREKLYQEFATREGEIVNGTVQSVSSQNITVGLGRTEAVMPKGQQVNSERYRPHDKIRVYVLEVRRTNRGPQIIVSRNHRNLLRRLLELEVPEIYNGQVDIKSIAREAGQRSKVAVMALQPGVDPVGACVGMRGVRIQSIVRELNDEKIDVIEWDNNQENFIAKALSPARVSSVFLEQHPDTGKTAVVIVPDDQLSLAIGREGQNARLAAKLTGWRIDIKSLTEAARDSLELLGDPAANPVVVGDETLVEQVNKVLEKKEANRPITAEDYSYLTRLVNGVEGRIIAARAEAYEAIRQTRAEARKKISELAWEDELEELNLPLSIHTLLLENGVETAGEALYRLELDDTQLLEITGFGDKSLEIMKDRANEYRQLLAEREAELAAEAAAVVAEEAEVAEDAAPAAAADVEAVAEAEAVEEAAAVEEAVVEPEVEAEVETAVVEEEVVEEEEEPEVDFVEALAAEEAAEAEIESVVNPLDNLDMPLVSPKPKAKKKPVKKKKVVVVSPVESTTADEDDDSERSRSQKGKELVFDEDAGRVVVKRKRKGSRRRHDWEDISEFDDIDEFLD